MELSQVTPDAFVNDCGAHTEKRAKKKHPGGVIFGKALARIYGFISTISGAALSEANLSAKCPASCACDRLLFQGFVCWFSLTGLLRFLFSVLESFFFFLLR